LKENEIFNAEGIENHLRKSGFILPVVLVMVTVLITLGFWYLFSTVQSKNTFQVFYRDELARLIAQSAASEWRATFLKRVATDAALKKLISSPKSNPGNLSFSSDDVRKTGDLADRLVGRGRWEFTGAISVSHLDDELVENVQGTIKKDAFDKEYQATLRIEIKVGIGPQATRRFSSFLFEHDLKHVCVRSKPADRINRGYTSSALNDYVLYIRDCLGEFDQFSGKSLNDNSHTLTIAHSDNAKKGKILLGCGKSSDSQKADKYVFININDKLEYMMPDSPPDLTVDWATLKRAYMMPTVAAKIEAALDELKKLPNVGSINTDKIKGVISIEHKPLTGNDTWLQSLVKRIKDLIDHFFRDITGKEANREKAIHLLGAQDIDYSVCDLIEGNVRQRFWQTSTFKLDYSGISNDPQVLQIVKDQFTDLINVDIKYFPSENEIWRGFGPEPIEKKELYKVVKYLQGREKNILQSQPNAIFPFKKQPDYNLDRNAEGKFPYPPFIGRTRQLEFSEFMPFTAYLLRAYCFPSSQELYQSNFYDAKSNVLRLNGIFLIEDEKTGLILKNNLRFEGKGILISYGNITIEGKFSKTTPQEGPCILYTWCGNIIANAREQGLIEASLVALNWDYKQDNPNSPKSWVDFSKRRAEVKGNLVADRIMLDQMSSTQDNIITYDSDCLSGEELYAVNLGGRLRRTSAVFDDQSSK